MDIRSRHYLAPVDIYLFSFLHINDFLFTHMESHTT